MPISKNAFEYAAAPPDATTTTNTTTTTGAGLALLNKGFSVIEAVVQARRPPNLSEISRQTGIPTSTVHRILGALCAQGLVDREEDAYFPGWRSAHLFDPRLAPHWQALRDYTLPSMLGLHDALGCSVSLIAPTRRTAVVLLQLRATGAWATPASQSTDISLHHLTAARLLDAYRSEPTEPGCPLTADVDDPDAERARVRDTGHLRIRPADRRRTVSCLAVPVFDRARQVLAALTICAKWRSEDDEVVLHRLRSASSAATRALRTDAAAAPRWIPMVDD